MKQDTICIHSLSIGYVSKNDTRRVANDIHATIYSGELTCLLGANGVGKSTLLRTLSAFQPKLGGSISVLGKDIDSYTSKELAHLIGVVLTEKSDLHSMTVLELVQLGRTPYTGFWGKLSPKDLRVAETAIALVKIEDLTHRMVHTLSDGERQKVMIAKALAQETPIIYLDEPTAFLDFPSKVEIMQLLHTLTRKVNKTIFLSTHDLELALQLADKIWLMDKPHGIRTGTPEDLALSGALPHFFERTGIAFEPQTGLFRIETPCLKRLRLTGSGPGYAMARKALQRNGIEAGATIESDIYLEATAAERPEFILHPPQQAPIQLASIEEMLAKVLPLFYFQGNGKVPLHLR